MYSRIFGLCILIVVVESLAIRPYYPDLNVSPAELKELKEQHEHHEEDYDEPPKYKFDYSVQDHKTKDFKNHKEERDGDVVKGEYTVADPDGIIRTVKYTVDKHSGFQAVVTLSGKKHQEPVHHSSNYLPKYVPAVEEEIRYQDLPKYPPSPKLEHLDLPELPRFAPGIQQPRELRSSNYLTKFIPAVQPLRFR